MARRTPGTRNAGHGQRPASVGVSTATRGPVADAPNWVDARTVPLFKLIRSFDDLPTAGETTRTKETQSIDFKRSYSPENRAEMAKDMAAFANALGGVILVGTSEDDKPLAYPGVSRDFAERLSDGFADAHAHHLSPKPPTIEPVIVAIPNSDRVLFAVNVHPFLGPDRWSENRLQRLAISCPRRRCHK